LKPKDLIGIPWRVAFALQADGWYLRQDIIWHKPNPMPESVRDRCTKAHEYIFLLSKSARYYFDGEAIFEKATGAAPGNIKPTKGAREYLGGAMKHRTAANLHKVCARETRNRRSVWTVATTPFKGAHFATFPPAIPELCIKAASRPGDTVLDPFGGAGTSGLVADQLGRRAILIELNREYAAMASQRIYGAAPLFAEEMA
jgi:DNA modification methylase